jgi:hypothetical protein
MANNFEVIFEAFTATESSKVFSGDQPSIGMNARAVVSLTILTLRMEAETVSETLNYNAILTRLISREDFIATVLIIHDKFKTYGTKQYSARRGLSVGKDSSAVVLQTFTR